jgi:hypothetical protein
VRYDIYIYMSLGVKGITDKFFIVQPEDGQHLWPKHVAVLYIQ